MLRTVHAFLPVPGDPEPLHRAYVDDPGRWLPEARQLGPDQWTMTVRAGRFTRTVVAHLGTPWRAGKTCWRSLSWDPAMEGATARATDHLLPSLDGELGLNARDGQATLVLDARYRPPVGPLGAAVDGVAFKRVAHHTLVRLLSEVAARLCSEAVLMTPVRARHAASEGEQP
jgi:hypothetical protein